MHRGMMHRAVMQPALDDFSGRVFNVQRFSVHDGPGIRTTLFLKGCPLRCQWCDNPESQRGEPQIVFWRERCIQCNACLDACPRAAVAVDADGRKQVLTDRCDLCGLCIEECYAGALERIGRAMTVANAIAQVEEDRAFYDRSGGGVTLSGGESLSQPEFSRRILQGCRARGIHTAIETSGYASWSTWQTLLPHLDLILYDLKEVDSSEHQRGTGVPSELILDNLRQLANTGKPIIVRRPVIPGFNDTPESITALAHFLRELGTIQEINLLPYHRFGRGKYEQLEIAYPMGDRPALPEEQVADLKDLLVSYGFRVKIGG
jgi:pyruvate formate lyase activating enzyme